MTTVKLFPYIFEPSLKSSLNCPNLAVAELAEAKAALLGVQASLRQAQASSRILKFYEAVKLFPKLNLQSRNRRLLQL